MIECPAFAGSSRRAWPTRTLRRIAHEPSPPPLAAYWLVTTPICPWRRSAIGFQHLNSPSGVRPGDHILFRSDMGARKPQGLVSHTRDVHCGASRNYGKVRNVPSRIKSHLFVGSLCKNSRRLCGTARHVAGCPGSTLTRRPPTSGSATDPEIAPAI
jgi:hypothetical protein